MTDKMKVGRAPSRGAGGRGRGPDPLDPHGEIARRLRLLYSEDAREPIPAELIALLERLDEAEEKHGR